MPPELEERVRELCAQIIVAAEQTEFGTLVEELKLLLHEHTLALENLVTEQALLIGLGTATALEESKQVSRSRRKKPA